MRKALGLPRISIRSSRAHDAPRGQARVDLDAQRLAVEVVAHVERAEAPSRAQRIGHEVGRPDLVRLYGDHQRGLHTCRQPRFVTALHVHPQRSIRAGRPALAEAHAAHGWIQLVEAVARGLVDVALDRYDDRAVVPRPRSRVVSRSREACRAARLAHRQRVFGHQHVHELSSDLRCHSLFFDHVLEDLVREGHRGVHLLGHAVLGLKLFAAREAARRLDRRNSPSGCRTSPR